MFASSSYKAVKRSEPTEKSRREHRHVLSVVKGAHRVIQREICERIILLSHGKERAAIISMEDLRLLEAIHNKQEREQHQLRQQMLLDETRQLREKMADAGYQTDSVAALEEVREERLDDLMDLR